MKRDAEMVLTFEWDGKTVKKETSGFTGKSCADTTKFIEEALHGQNQKRSFKAEYYRHDEAKVKDTRLRA